MKRAMLAAAVFFAAQAAVWAKPLALSLPAVSGAGLFSIPAAEDLPTPAPVPGVVVPSTAPTASDATSHPDWAFTPGRLCTPKDPDFKEYRYPERIPYCNRHVTPEMKQQVAAHYGIPQSDWPKYEFDHLIPLGIGGNSGVENLWPEPRGMNGGSDEKDKLEQELFDLLSAGKITQAEAVRRLYAWFRVQPPMKDMPSAPVAAAGL